VRKAGLTCDLYCFKVGVVHDVMILLVESVLLTRVGTGGSLVCLGSLGFLHLLMVRLLSVGMLHLDTSPIEVFEIAMVRFSIF
jgi:hypothetical protein